MDKDSAMAAAAKVPGQDEIELRQEVTQFEQCSGDAQRFTGLAMRNLLKFAIVDNNWEVALDTFNNNVVPILEDVEDCLGRDMVITRNRLTNMAQILSRGATVGFDEESEGERFLINTVQGAIEDFWFDYTKGATKSPGRTGRKTWEHRTKIFRKKLKGDIEK